MNPSQWKESIFWAKGFEPCGPDSQVIGHQCGYGEEDVVSVQIDSQRLGANSPDLARVVASWKNLPENVKQEINMLVAHYCEELAVLIN